MGPGVSLFLNDLTNYEVLYEKDGDKQVVRGLPIMRPGKFNGKDYSAADLQQMADNFVRLRDEESWSPALKARHTYDARTGQPENADAREVMAWLSDLRFDEEDGVLFGDLEVVEESMIADMQKGKLRYLSAETVDDYVLEGGDEDKSIGPALVGVAWVDDPAVKRLPWEIVLNRAEYSHLQDVVHTQQLGDLSASELSEKLQAALAELPDYAGDDFGPYVRDVFDGYMVVSHEGRYYRHNYEVDGVKVTVEPERIEVKQTWTDALRGEIPMTRIHADTTESRPMKQTLLPPECFLIVGDIDEPDSWHLPYRDADTSSEKTDRWGRVERYTKAGPISCPRVRAIAGALRGARGSEWTPSDLDATAKRRLKAAATACEVESEVIDELSSEGGAKTMSSWEKFKEGLVSVLKGEAKPESLADLDDPVGVEDPERLPEGADVVADTLGNRPAGDDDQDQTLRLLAQERKAREELAGQVEALTVARRRDQAEALVDDLVREGYVPPAQRRQAYVLLEYLLARDDKVTVLVRAEEDGGEEEAEQPIAQVVLTLLKACSSQAVRRGPQGLVWEGSEDPDQASDAQADTVATKMAAMANEPED